MVNGPHFRGYTRPGGGFTGGQVDWREQIDIGPERSPLPAPAEPCLRLQGPNQWPDALPELPGVIAERDALLSKIGRSLLRHLAVAFGSRRHVLDMTFSDDPATLLRVIRYPGGVPSDQGVGARRDAGVLTLLLAEPGSTGLQVRTDEGYVDFVPLPGSLIVNIGEMVEIDSGGYLRATEHHVRIQQAERLSVAYLFNPRLDALARPAAARRAGSSGPRSHRHPATDRSYAGYGRNAGKSRLRAHPDVAAAHRYV